MSVDLYSQHPDLRPDPKGLAKKRLKAATALRMQQIEIAQWLTAEGKSGYSVIGLGTDGAVYRYQAGEEGWVPFSMRKVCGSNYGH